MKVRACRSFTPGPPMAFNLRVKVLTVALHYLLPAPISCDCLCSGLGSLNAPSISLLQGFSACSSLCLKPLLPCIHMACTLTCFRIENVVVPFSDFLLNSYWDNRTVELLLRKAIWLPDISWICLFVSICLLVECQHCIGRDLVCSVHCGIHSD